MDRNRPKQLTPADWAIDAAKELALAWAWLQREKAKEPVPGVPDEYLGFP